jgi:hypothetical protein
VSRQLTPEFLASIAEQYKTHVAERKPPAPRIAEAEGAPVATVRRWIFEARKVGLLPPGHPSIVSPRLPEAKPSPRKWWLERQEATGRWIAFGSPHPSRTAALIALGAARSEQPDLPRLRIVRATTHLVVEHVEH